MPIKAWLHTSGTQKQGKLPIVKMDNEQSDRCLNNDSIANSVEAMTWKSLLNF